MARPCSKGKFHLFGGWDGTRYLADTLIYDPDTDSWAAGTPMAEPRAFLAASSLQDRIYVVGGYDGQRELATVAAYDPAGERTGPVLPSRVPLSQPRGGLGALHRDSGYMLWAVVGLSRCCSTSNTTSRPAPVAYRDARGGAVAQFGSGCAGKQALRWSAAGMAATWERTRSIRRCYSSCCRCLRGAMRKTDERPMTEDEELSPFGPSSFVFRHNAGFASFWIFGSVSCQLMR